MNRRTELLALGAATLVYWLGGALLFWLCWMLNVAMGGSSDTHLWIVGYAIFALSMTLYNAFAVLKGRRK